MCFSRTLKYLKREINNDEFALAAQLGKKVA